MDFMFSILLLSIAGRAKLRLLHAWRNASEETGRARTKWTAAHRGSGGGCYVASSAAKEVHIVGAVGIIHETIDRCFYRFINKTLGGLGGDSSGWIEGFFG